DAELGCLDLPRLGQLPQRALDRVDRDGEADALEAGGAAAGADLSVDADHAAASVDEGAARVAVFDWRVGLDGVDEVVAGGQRGDRAADGRDDADGEGV